MRGCAYCIPVAGARGPREIDLDKRKEKEKEEKGGKREREGEEMGEKNGSEEWSHERERDRENERKRKKGCLSWRERVRKYALDFRVCIGGTTCCS